jgi:hypothetical protein
MLGALLLRTSTLCFLWVLLLTLATHAQEFRPKILQKKHYHPKLTEAQTILVHTSATIHHKPVNADPLLHIIRSQMERVGYTVITQSSQAHDVTIEIRCEEPDRSTWSHAPQQPIAPLHWDHPASSNISYKGHLKSGNALIVLFLMRGSRQ